MKDLFKAELLRFRTGAVVTALVHVVVQAIELHHDTTAPGDIHAGVVNAVRLAQAAAECIERGDARFQGIGLTPEQIELIDEEFALTEIMPQSREPLLAI